MVRTLGESGRGDGLHCFRGLGTSEQFSGIARHFAGSNFILSHKYLTLKIMGNIARYDNSKNNTKLL